MSLHDQPVQAVPAELRAGLRKAGEWVSGLTGLDLVWRQQCPLGYESQGLLGTAGGDKQHRALAGSQPSITHQHIYPHRPHWNCRLPR